MTAQTMTFRCPHCHQNVEAEVHPENEVLLCPNEACKKPFKIDVPTAEPVSELIVPPEANGQVAPAATAKPVADTAPEIPEQVLWTLSLSMLRRYPFRCVLYLLVIGGTALGSVLYALSGWTFGAIVCLAVCVAVATRFCLWWLRMRNTTLSITNKRFILQRG